MQRQTIHCGISRNVKQISVIDSVSPTEKIAHPLHNSVAGFCLGPIATQEVQCSVRKGFGLEVESEAIYQHKYLFDSIRTVVLTNFVEVRALDEFPEEMAVLLMDNLSSQLISDMIGLLTDGRVRIITFTLRTTQIFQSFDVTSLVFSNGIQDMNCLPETRKRL
jgi:hypothetical protein